MLLTSITLDITLDNTSQYQSQSKKGQMARKNKLKRVQTEGMEARYTKETSRFLYFSSNLPSCELQCPGTTHYCPPFLLAWFLWVGGVQHVSVFRISQVGK